MTALTAELRRLFTVTANCEEVLMTTAETPAEKKEKRRRTVAHEREAQDHIPGWWKWTSSISGPDVDGLSLARAAGVLICDQRQRLSERRSHAGSGEESADVVLCSPILPLCFLPINCGGANDSIIRYSIETESVCFSLVTPPCPFDLC